MQFLLEFCWKLVGFWLETGWALAGNVRMAAGFLPEKVENLLGCGGTSAGFCVKKMVLTSQNEATDLLDCHAMIRSASSSAMEDGKTEEPLRSP